MVVTERVGSHRGSVQLPEGSDALFAALKAAIKDPPQVDFTLPAEQSSHQETLAQTPDLPPPLPETFPEQITSDRLLKQANQVVEEAIKKQEVVVTPSKSVDNFMGKFIRFEYPQLQKCREYKFVLETETEVRVLIDTTDDKESFELPRILIDLRKFLKQYQPVEIVQEVVTTSPKRYRFTLTCENNKTLSICATFYENLDELKNESSQTLRAQEIVRDLTAIENSSETIIAQPERLNRLWRLIQLQDPKVKAILAKHPLIDPMDVQILNDYRKETINLLPSRYLHGTGLLIDAILFPFASDSVFNTTTHEQLTELDPDILISAILGHMLVAANKELSPLLTPTYIQESEHISYVREVALDDRPQLFEVPSIVDQVRPLPITDFSPLNEVDFQPRIQTRKVKRKNEEVDTLLENYSLNFPAETEFVIQAPGWDVAFFVKSNGTLESLFSKTSALASHLGFDWGVGVTEWAEVGTALVIRQRNEETTSQPIVLYNLDQADLEQLQADSNIHINGDRGRNIEEIRKRMEVTIRNRFLQAIDRAYANIGEVPLRDQLTQVLGMAAVEVKTWLDGLNDLDPSAQVINLACIDPDSLTMNFSSGRNFYNFTNDAKICFIRMYERVAKSGLVDFANFHLMNRLTETEQTRLLNALPSEVTSRTISQDVRVPRKVAGIQLPVVKQIQSVDQVIPIAINTTEVHRLITTSIVKGEAFGLPKDLEPALVEGLNSIITKASIVEAKTKTTEESNEVLSALEPLLGLVLAQAEKFEYWGANHWDAIRGLVRNTRGIDTKTIKLRFRNELIKPAYRNLLVQIRTNVIHYLQVMASSNNPEAVKTGEALAQNRLISLLIGNRSQETAATDVAQFIKAIELPPAPQPPKVTETEILAELGTGIIDFANKIDQLAKGPVSVNVDIAGVYNAAASKRQGENQYSELKTYVNTTVGRIKHRAAERAKTNETTFITNLHQHVWPQVVEYLATAADLDEDAKANLLKRTPVMVRVIAEALGITLDRLNGSTESITNLYDLVAQQEVTLLRVPAGQVNLGWKYKGAQPGAIKPAAKSKAELAKEAALGKILAYVSKDTTPVASTTHTSNPKLDAFQAFMAELETDADVPSLMDLLDDDDKGSYFDDDDFFEDDDEDGLGDTGPMAAIDDEVETELSADDVAQLEAYIQQELGAQNRTAAHKK